MDFAKTELGRKLCEIRQRIKAGGQPLLDWGEIDREVRERRGDDHERIVDGLRQTQS